MSGAASGGSSVVKSCKPRRSLGALPEVVPFVPGGFGGLKAQELQRSPLVAGEATLRDE